MVTPASKNKEAAYRVIMSMITDEAQKEMNAGARLTALKDLELRKQFASNLKVYDGKNLAGIFSISPSPLPEATKYDARIYTFLGEAMRDMILNNVDVNTTLREANEKAEKYIQEQKAQ